MGYGPVSQQPFTEDELKLVLMDSHEEGVITESEAKIIIRAFEFADKRAEEIMIPPSALITFRWRGPSRAILKRRGSICTLDSRSVAPVSIRWRES
jgi:CBS domain containing-hemolysin-like protein